MFEPENVAKMIKAIQARNKAQKEMVDTYIELWGLPERGSIGQDPAYEESLDENVTNEIKRQMKEQGAEKDIDEVLAQWEFLIVEVQ